MLDWNHNAYYHRLLLSQLPQRCDRVLDVGCGNGSFAARLAGRVEHVDAVDRTAAMIEVARQRTPENVNCILADALTDPLPGGGYNAIFSISALHHMPLQDALLRFAALLRPGGVLAVVALPRVDLPHELPTEIVASRSHARRHGSPADHPRSRRPGQHGAARRAGAPTPLLALPTALAQANRTSGLANQGGTPYQGFNRLRMI